MIESYKGVMPSIDKDARVHVMAYVQGDVTIGAGSSIWPGASVRGDVDNVKIGANSNVQDNATVHVTQGIPVSIGDNVTVGHNAIVHSAIIEDDCIIGMGAIVLDGARVGAGCIIGAGAVIGPNKVIPARSIVVGNPFKILREASDKDVAANVENARDYYLLSRDFSL